MTLLYVTSEKRGEGKTAFCVGLAQLLTEQGKKATVFKPIASADDDPDVGIYKSLLSTEVDGWPIATAPARVSDELVGQIKTAASLASEDNDIVIVEGASDISSADDSKVVEALDAKAVVISRYSRENNATDLRKWQDAFKERLIGYVINAVTKYQGTESRSGLLESMASQGLKSLGTLPEDRRLLGVSVNQLSEHLGGEYLLDGGDRDSLVEYLVVGGLSMDPGEVYFGLHENRAVVVRGDRPDIQMAALLAPGNTACMVLTNGIKPTEYVLNEVELEELPLVMVSEGTLATMDNLNTLMKTCRFDHPAKLERFSALMRERIDIDVISKALEPS
jgi:BioD-like phosphotransacetylase family protein